MSHRDSKGVEKEQLSYKLTKKNQRKKSLYLTAIL
jgi:hypothetical protein